MPTYSKIPQKEKAKGAITSGRFAVFGRLLSVGPAFTKLQSIKKAFPAHGYITIVGKRYYYCLYGLVDDPDIYAKKSK